MEELSDRVHHDLQSEPEEDYVIRCPKCGKWYDAGPAGAPHVDCEGGL